MGKFREHSLMLYLSKELYIAHIKVQADKRLGRSFAGLLPYVTGLYYMGYITKPVFLKYQQRYSVPLDKEPQQTLLEQHKQTRERQELENMFKMVIAQVELHKGKLGWCKKWIMKAQEHGDIPEARELLILLTEKKKV